MGVRVSLHIQFFVLTILTSFYVSMCVEAGD